MYRTGALSLSPLDSPRPGPCQDLSPGALEPDSERPQKAVVDPMGDSESSLCDGRSSDGRSSDSRSNDGATGDAPSVPVGQLWSVDASGLDPEKLGGPAGRVALQGLFEELIQSAGLHPVGDPIWHVFPGPHAGVTGIVALSESHLSCHSFPEHGGVALDLYTCRERPGPPWAEIVGRHLGHLDRPVHVAVHAQPRSFRALGAASPSASFSGSEASPLSSHGSPS